MLYKIKERKMFLSMHKAVVHSVCENMQEQLSDTLSNVSEVSRTYKILTKGENNFQALRNLCKQRMHHTKFSLMPVT